MLDGAASRTAERTSDFAFTSHGARLAIHVSEPDLLDAVVTRLPPGWRPERPQAAQVAFSLRVAPGSARAHELYRGTIPIASEPTLDGVLDVLESELHFAVATHARPHLFVHAGALEWRGRGLLLPGRSMTGKSELTAALVTAGATYYSDEYAVLDRAGRLHPYAKALGLRATHVRGAKVRLALPDRASGGPVPVAAIAVTSYEAGAAWHPRRLSAGEAMVALLDNTVLARARPEVVMVTLGRTATDAVAVAGPRGDAEEAAERLLAYMESSATCCADRR